MIPGVKELDTTLRLDALGNPRCLEQRQVSIPDRRAAERVSRQTAVLNDRTGRIGRQCGDAGRERKGIDVKVTARGHAGKRIADLRRTNQTAVADNAERESRPRALDYIQLPAADKAVPVTPVPEPLYLAKW